MESASSLAASSQALERRARLAKTFAYYLAFVVLGMAAASFGPTLPGLAEHVRSSIGSISALFVLRSGGYLTGSVLAGRLYDRVKGHPLMVAVILLLAVCMFIIPVVPLIWLLGGVVFVLGTAEGILDVGGNTLLVWVHRDNMGPFMNGLHFFFGFGAFISPIIIAQAVLASGDIYWAYWALALIMLPAALWIARLPSPAPIVSAGKAAEKPILPVLIALIAVFNFLYVGAEVSFGGWVFTYATAMNLGSETVAAYLTSGFWGALTVGRLLSIPIAARFRPNSILLVDLLLVLTGLALVLVLPQSFTALWAGTILVGAGMASVFPAILTLADRHMTITGNVTSWFFVGSSLGGMTLPWMIGLLFEPVGPQVAMVAITISSALSLVIFLVMMAYTKKITRANR